MKDSLLKEGKIQLIETLQEARKRNNCYKLTVPWGTHMLTLRLSDILYIAILKKQSEIFLTESCTREIARLLNISEKDVKGFTIKSKRKVEEYYNELKDHGFVYAKVSYIINVRHVTGYFKEYVQLTGGTQLAVARSKRAQFEKELSSFWERN